MCRKPNIGSDSVLKNLTVQKFDICSGGFPTEAVRNPQFRLKVTKANFTCCIQCTDKEHFKTLPEQSLACRI